MKFGSVCSGIEAASVAWNGLGWKASWFAEIEQFPSAVLNHHYPEVPNLGDMTKLPEKILNQEIDAPDILCGGTPCQAFSVAGNRQSPSRSPQSTEVTNQVYSVYQSCMAVRRLTPRECERLQGFPDDYTKIPYRNKDSEKCPDGPRYKALGNSWAVPVVRWIGERIVKYGS